MEEGLSSAARYEEAYTQLSHQFSLLISRNALAEDEVSYLSSVNASLVGHTNPYQRIRHVDKIRRELGETKQSLLEACLERDEALQENGNLREELNSYRAIDVPLKDKPRAKLLRVSRAQGYGQGHGLGQSHAVGVPLRASRSVNTINSRSVGPARRAAGVGAPPKAVTAAGAARNVGLIPMAKVDGALEDAGERDQGWADENEMTLDELRAR